jgi:hypothetical protein
VLALLLRVLCEFACVDDLVSFTFCHLLFFSHRPG